MLCESLCESVCHVYGDDDEDNADRLNDWSLNARFCDCKTKPPVKL